MGEREGGFREWVAEDGTRFIDKGDGERFIVRDTDGDGYADKVYETGRDNDASEDDD